MNLLVMSLVSAAALSFSSCSNNDDLGGGAGTQSQVKGFYMTLAVQTPTSNGTRTAQSNETAATAAESDVTSGTLYLVDANGEIAFQKDITAAEWEASKIPTNGQTGKTQIQIQVEQVAAGATYKVYFLANTTAAKPWENILTATSKFAKPFVTDKAFAMFNQNDATVNGNGYTVVFTDANKEIKTPAQVIYNKQTSPIKIERIAARIDEPNPASNEIKGYVGTNATEAEKRAMADALAKVKDLKLTRYAISNLANQSYIMQNGQIRLHWLFLLVQALLIITLQQNSVQRRSSSMLIASQLQLQHSLIRTMSSRTILQHLLQQCTSSTRLPLRI